MIYVSILLLAIAIVLLTAGAVLQQVLVVATSIGVCLVAALLLYLGTRRSHARATGTRRDTGERAKKDSTTRGTRSSAPQRRGAPGTRPESAEPEMAELLEHPLATARASKAADGTRSASVSQLPIRRQETHRDPEDPPDEPDIEATGPLTERVADHDEEVIVIDGRPRFHLLECAHLETYLTGAESEPVPLWEAVELGFTPCARCTPIASLLSPDRGVADS